MGYHVKCSKVLRFAGGALTETVILSYFLSRCTALAACTSGHTVVGGVDTLTTISKSFCNTRDTG